MPRVVARSVLDAAAVDALLRPRTDLLMEQAAGDGRFVSSVGPVLDYERKVEVVPADDDGRAVVTQTVDFRLAVPYWGWLFLLPFKRSIVRPPTGRIPWWAPPAPLDARASGVLGSLAALSVVMGYLNTLFTQTVTFAGADFGAGNQAQGIAGGVVRLGGFLALAVVTIADHRGRRRVIFAASLAGCALAATGALAPSLAWLTGSQAVARGFAGALLLLIGIVAAEEVPARSRAYAISLLAMAGGLGAGMAVMALRLADLDRGGWRILYVIPVAAIPLILSVGRRLPESRRFLAPHPEVHIAGHGGRLWLLAVSGLLINLFIAPQSQFNNQFLRTERGFTGGGIALLTLIAGTPAVIGIVIGGRLADMRGRRMVAAVALLGGASCTVAYYFSHGPALYGLALAGNVISAASIPALGVYGPELFPTSLRGRANGLVSVCALGGSAAGLALAGTLGDHFGRLGPAMSVLAAGPLLVAILIVLAYPETAGRELEDLNPEDRYREEAEGPR
ncbi:MAG: MFS transporter [Actinomycetota bacterium]|nr:MFS transporter [Actinomycetota bacterium]